MYLIGGCNVFVLSPILLKVHKELRPRLERVNNYPQAEPSPRYLSSKIEATLLVGKLIIRMVCLSFVPTMYDSIWNVIFVFIRDAASMAMICLKDQKRLQPSEVRPILFVV